MKIKDKIIGQHNKWQASTSKTFDAVIKPVRWEMPNFLKNFQDYFGVGLPIVKNKPTDYNNKLFGNNS